MGTSSLSPKPSLNFADLSPETLQRSSQLSPAIDRYLKILKNKPETFEDELRCERHKSWITAAAATLTQSHSTRDICDYWSLRADEILKKAWQHSGLNQEPLALFALGKLGSLELNLSSDVDLLIISETLPTPEMYKKFREFNRVLTQNTEFGFALRTDFDLRPGGRFSSTIISLGQAEDYYWTQGATWERLANIRLRPIIGNAKVSNAYLELLKRYIYRRHIDYSLLEDLKSIRTQIHFHYGAKQLDFFNIKLGIGGIRDIELFAHALLVLHGGRRPDLIHVRTDEIYQGLINAKVYDEFALKKLMAYYWQFRALENEVQAANDEQDHIIQFAQKPIQKTLLTQTSEVNTIVSDLLGTPKEQDLSEQDMSALGFSTRAQNEIWPQLLSLSAQSSRSEYDESMRKEFLFQFVHFLSRDGVDKDLGLSLLIDFLKATRAKASFYSLFVNEPRIIRDLARLFSISPYLGQVLASRPELVDSFLFGLQPTAPKSIDRLLEYCAEKKLLCEIFAAIALLDQQPVEVVGKNLSTNADEIINLLLNYLIQENDSAPLEILALGKWGGEELGLRSDLDFIFVTDSEIGPSEQKVARKMVSLLTAAQKGGMIYQIDLRLRPSGKAGPMLVSKSKLLDYLKTEAAAWERQSYLRSRIIGAQKNWTHEIHQACVSKDLSEDDLKEFNRIREQLTQYQSGGLDLKQSVGGLIDIEFTAQIYCLKNKQLGRNTTTLSMLEVLKSPRLMKNYSYIRGVEQMLSLVSGTTLHHWKTGTHESLRLAQLLKTDEESLDQKIIKVMNESAGLVKDLDPIFAAR
jgi:glutamate-ammonia-ligase adenylyltransferase